MLSTISDVWWYMYLKIYFTIVFGLIKKKKKKVFRMKILSPTMCLYRGVEPNYAVNGKKRGGCPYQESPLHPVI